MFVLVLYHFESHLSLLSRASFSPAWHRYFRIFFSLMDSNLSAIPHPTSPSYSHVHIDIHLHAHTHPLHPTGCTCVPGFGPDTARVAAVESWKCSSCLIRRYNGRQHEDGQEKRQNTHTCMKLTEKAHTASRMPLVAQIFCLFVCLWKLDIACKQSFCGVKLKNFIC